MLHRSLRSTVSSSIRCARRSLFVNTESTPNPQSMKFLPGKEVLPEAYGTGMHFQNTDKKEISRSPLVKALFNDIKGLKSIFLGRDFLTITKQNEENWIRLKPMVFAKLLDFYSEGKAVVEDQPSVSDTTILESDGEVVAAIKELIETRVRPSVQEDGGDIFFVGFDERTGIVRVRLAGSCVGCPSSSVTLRNGVENMLMHYIPEVKGIEEAPAEDAACDSEGGGVKDSTQERLKLEFHPDFTVASKEK
jgi:Fe-S cluster biogenesis protein NfuA